jgi:hypothetical protein
MANQALPLDTQIVLLFSTVAHPSRAARVHAPECNMVNTAGRKVSKTEGTVAELQWMIDDLNEREFPVKFCKCIRKK